MALAGLKRSGERSRDVRSFSVVPEHKPVEREKFRLAENMFPLLLEKVGRFDVSTAAKLKYLFPEEALEIAEAVGVNKDDVEIVTREHLRRETAEKVAFKLWFPELDFTDALIPPRELQLEICQKLRFKKTNDLAALIHDFTRLLEMEIIFPDYTFAEKGLYWGIGKECLEKLMDAEQIAVATRLASVLKVLYPKQYREQKKLFLKVFAAGLAELEKLDQQGDIFGSYICLAYDLTILDADAIIINEQGLHLNYALAPENLEQAVPEQPTIKEI